MGSMKPSCTALHTASCVWLSSGQTTTVRLQIFLSLRRLMSNLKSLIVFLSPGIVNRFSVTVLYCDKDNTLF